MDRSGQPVWFLAMIVVPNFQLSDSSKPTKDEVAEKLKFVRHLEKAVRCYLRADDIEGARGCFHDLWRVLLLLKKDKLRAAYNDQIWRVHKQFENQWPSYQAQARKKRAERWAKRGY